MAQGVPSKAAPVAVGQAGPSQLDTLLPNPPPYEASARVEEGREIVDGRTVRSRVNYRFLTAWFWGIVVWVLMSGLLRSYYEILWPRHRHHVNKLGEKPEMSHYAFDDYSIGLCQEWYTKEDRNHTLPFLGEAHVELPLNHQSLFLFSQEPWPKGRLRIISDNKIPSDRVQLNITVRSVSRWLQDSSKVCSASLPDGSHGVGLFARHQGPQYQALSPNELMLFEATLAFPAKQPTTMTTLHIDTPGTFPEIDCLSEHLFDRVDIQAFNTPVEVEMCDG